MDLKYESSYAYTSTVKAFQNIFFLEFYTYSFILFFYIYCMCLNVHDVSA